MWSNTLLKRKVVKTRENVRKKLNDTGIPKFPKKIIKLSTSRIRQNLSLPKSMIKLRREVSNDETKNKIKIDFNLIQKQQHQLKQKLTDFNIKEEEVKPPRIPRHNMVLNREKIQQQTDLAFEKGKESMHLLSVKEDNCKCNKNNILDIDILVRFPSPNNHYYAINEENGDESTLRLEVSPNTPIKVEESPSQAKITQKRVFKNFRKL